jgi:hypothetical protein
MKKSFYLVIASMLFLVGGISCSSDDDFDTVTTSSSAILGEWELDTVCFVFGDDYKVPTGKRDTYLFGPNGKVRVVRGDWDDSFFLGEGEYDYFYDETKQEIEINGKMRSCIISDGTIAISGDASAFNDSTTKFILKRK